MASSDPSRRASVASSSDMSPVDPAVAAKVLPKKDKPSGPLKLKKSIAKNSRPKDSAETRSPSPNSPSINGNDAESRASVPPGQTKGERVRCKHCREPIAAASMGSHVKSCPEKKKKDKVPKKKDSQDALVKTTVSSEDKDGELRDDDPVAGKLDGAEATAAAQAVSSVKDVVKSGKKTAVKEATTDNTSKKTKKRKAELEGDKEPKKKKLKKDEPPKPKMPKPKGPVDVEKQCGVLLPNGGYCARSLTCKSHSMGAKRGVPGRSMPYDFLLAQYQKKNQAKQQKAAMDANAPLIDDTDANVPVDSDEEKDAYMAGLARWRPQPLAQHVFVGCRSKYNRIRVKEALAQALAGQRGSNMFAVRPPEASGTVTATQSAAGAGSNVEGADASSTPVDLGTGPGNALFNGTNQEGGNSGIGQLERRPSAVQQGLGANAGADAAVGGNGSSRNGATTDGPVRKATVAATAA
ncbi:SAGA complex subunit Sgf73 [Xanthoria calcicola]